MKKQKEDEIIVVERRCKYCNKLIYLPKRSFCCYEHGDLWIEQEKEKNREM